MAQFSFGCGISCPPKAVGLGLFPRISFAESSVDEFPNAYGKMGKIVARQRCPSRGDLRSLFSFDNKAVLELGCGPLLGWGPLVLFFGADVVKQQYFIPMRQELVANFGELLPFDEWFYRIQSRSQKMDLNGSSVIDITLSNSVLQHVPVEELKTLIGQLSQAAKPGAILSCC